MVYPLFTPGQLFWPVVYSLVGGALAGAIVLLDSLVADSIDYDRLRSRREREGLYFGVWKMSTKISRALGLALAGLLLDLIGFDEEMATVAPETSEFLAQSSDCALSRPVVCCGACRWTTRCMSGSRACCAVAKAKSLIYNSAGAVRTWLQS